jgi:DNA-binding NarL/FixJ family response regulator
MDPSAIQIVMADNQYLVTRSVTDIIRDRLHLSVSVVVTDRNDLEKIMKEGLLSLLIIDISQFDFVNPADLKKFLITDTRIPVLVLTNGLTKNELSELQVIGVKNILFKSTSEEELIMAISHALQGRKYFGHDVLEIMLENASPKKAVTENVSLTAAETEIVRLIAEGKTTKEIANRKNVSFHTIMTHRKNIFRKVKVNNASELVMFAIRTGIIDIIEYQI